MPTNGIESAASPIDLDKLRATPLIEDPFPHVIVPEFVRAAAMPAIQADFPAIEKPGSFPVPSLRFGPHFRHLLDAFYEADMADVFSEKFDLDLRRLPLMATVRGRTQAKDGRIHVDSKSKVITVLIYMNAAWEAAGGRLRLLRSPDDLEDMVAEVPPQAGTLLAFRNGPSAWHGHQPFVGQRRTIQLNWVTGTAVVAREQARHRLSAAVKRLNPFA